MRVGIALHSFYDPDNVGGVRAYVHALIRNLLYLRGGNRYVLLIAPDARQHFETLIESWNLEPASVQLTQVPCDASPYHALVHAAHIRDFLNGLSLDVIHFPIHWMYPQGLDTPTVLSPHDIQHLHLPRFFSSEELDSRERLTYASCKWATRIVTQSEFVKNDLIQHFGLAPGKIRVVQLAADEIFHTPVTAAALQQVRGDYLLPDRFIYYPAQLWPHKNHVTLIRVLAAMRRNDHLDIPVVLTGSRQDGYEAIVKEISEHGLSGQVVYLDAIPFGKLPLIYRLSRGVIVPSLHEGSSFPVLEAFATGTPVIASNIPPMRELIQDPEFLFDPTNEKEMAEKLRSVWCDDEFLEKAKRYAASQGGKYSWKSVAGAMAEVYRDAAQAGPLPHHDEVAMRETTGAQADVIEGLRERLKETEVALLEIEKDRVAKERIISAIRRDWGYRASRRLRKIFGGH